MRVTEQALEQKPVVRALNDDDLDRAIDIWSIAFGFMARDRWLTFARETVDLLVGAFVDGELQAVSAVIDFDAHFAGTWVKAGGIAAVASSPPARRQGLTRYVLAECVRNLNERGVALACLWPFSHPYYARMGWAMSDSRYIIDVGLDSVITDGRSESYRQISQNDYSMLFGLHDRWCEHFNISFKRNDYRWKRMLTHPDKEPMFLFIHSDGYMVVNARDPKDRTLEVVEWCYMSEEAFRDGLALMKRMDDLRFDRARWISHEVESFLALGCTNPEPNIKLKPGMMTRVSNMESFLRCLSLNAGHDLSKAKITVIDPLNIVNFANGEQSVGPGEIVQIALGMWKKRSEKELLPFHGAAGQYPSFCVEGY